jgi:hypothetical protein
MTPKASPAGYERHVIPVVAADEHGGLGLDLAYWPDLIAVNVVDAAGAATLLSTTMLDAVLATRPLTVTVETLPLSHYRELVAGKARQSLTIAVAVRGLLRTHTVAEIASEIEAFLRHVRELVLLLSVYLVRHDDSRVAGAVRVLMNGADQCQASAFRLEDTVRCMDDIAYEIVPAIEKCLVLSDAVR